MKTPIKVVCEHCGSDDVTRDGLLMWSIPDQHWEVASELDNTDCNNCGRSNCLEDVEIDESDAD